MLQKFLVACLLGLSCCELFDITIKSTKNDASAMIRGYLFSKYEGYLNQVVGKLVPIRLPMDNRESEEVYRQLRSCTQESCIPFLVIDKEAPRTDLAYWMRFISRYRVLICGFEASGRNFEEQTSNSLQLVTSMSMIFVDYKDAKMTLTLARTNYIDNVTINPSTNHLKSREHFMKLGVLFLVFASACFILAMRVRAQRSMFVIRRHAEQTIKVRKAKAKIAQLPVRILMPTDMLVECTICLEDIKFPGKVKVLQCKHEYHEACITPWLVSNGTCPLCKYNVIEDCRSEVKDCQETRTYDMADSIGTSFILPIRNPVVSDITSTTESPEVEEPSAVAPGARLPVVSDA